MANENKNWGLGVADFLVLLDELENGKEQAFQKIFIQNYQKYRNYALKNLNISYDDAADVTTEAFVKIHRLLLERRIEYGNLEGYIMQIIRNEYLMLLRKRKQMPLSDIEITSLGLTEEEYDETTLQHFELAFEQLDEACRTLLQRHYFQKTPHREIGIELNISEDASKTRTKVCRNKLRELFLHRLNAA
ncbi:MAG: sigma-70 family RNA polymerase sigma factor [Haliscomenobacter sp.]|uniref:RNA polymerase sigma factor n=1 Tax=Haliscomenobacter sp. TaxID=2717303 RepID=UPI0029AF1104|nr:sigma-70 family RNA polymerase sigma factor [Haliscomenobacter sp.]MDX2068425.1 sigma-70 family RNA polymerase sigma factor [Haliscomenobacter sp.]